MKFIFCIVCILLSLIPKSATCLELNYRLLDKPQIQSFIDSQLNSINGRFSNFVIDILGVDQVLGYDFVNFIKNYNQLGASVTLFRKDCIYALLDTPSTSMQQTTSCKNVGNQLLSQLRQLDDSLSKSMISSTHKLSKNNRNIFESNSFIFLQFSVTSIISKLEPSIASVTFVSQSRTQVADQFSLEIGNQLSILQKVIRQSITELIPVPLRRDLESFWLFYINVLQERANEKERRDYWAVNVFDLNIKVNEFFYSCERNKRILSNNSYSICDDIHKDWNNILRQTLKF